MGSTTSKISAGKTKRCARKANCYITNITTVTSSTGNSLETTVPVVQWLKSLTLDKHLESDVASSSHAGYHD